MCAVTIIIISIGVPINRSKMFKLEHFQNMETNVICFKLQSKQLNIAEGLNAFG